MKTWMLTTLLLLGITALRPGRQAEHLTATTIGDRPSVHEFEIMLREVNNLRTNGCRCPGGKWYPPAAPLRWNDTLALASRRHAEDMQRRGFFKHTNPDGTDYAARVSAAGYDWKIVGENIASGYDGPKEVVEAWRNSKDHCRNLMHPEFREMGAAHHSQFWVQNLAARE